MRPELVIDPALIALAEKEQVRIPQRRQERIRITRAADAALLVGDHQVIRIDARGLGCHALEQAVLVQPGERERRLALLAGGLDFDFGSIRHERTHEHTGAVGQRVHPQQLMGRALFNLDQALEFYLGQEHGAHNLAEHGRIAPGK